ncbi:MAG: SLBB domain-containing protein [Fibrobacteres bacterium]|nr:SLBB domain-containing protein [Fibrobacterota bacterium]
MIKGGILKQSILSLFLLIALFVQVSEARPIKEGDVLEISVPGNATLSAKVVVNENGTIDYPLLTDRSVVGLSVREVMDLLTFAVAKSDPANMVVVNLLSEHKLKVNVLGQVKKPGMVMVDKGSSIQEILLQAEGATETANLSDIRLVRKDNTIEKSEQINLEAFLETGNLRELPEIKNGDTYIVLKEKRSRTVKVLGAVKKPGFFTPLSESNLFDLIQLAGGQMDDADLTKIRHITTVNNKRIDTFVNLRDFWEDFSSQDQIPKVQEGDIIIVYRKSITWTAFMGWLRDGVSLITVFVLVRGLALN